MAQITFTDEEIEVLLQTLQSYLSDLRMEISGTDTKDFRDQLKMKKEVLEEVLVKVRNSSSGKTAPEVSTHEADRP